MSFEDSERRKAASAGVIFRVAYGQEIFPAYTQGLVFDGYESETTYSSEKNLYSGTAEGVDARATLDKFYRYSQKYPSIRLGLPADIEVINWKDKDLDLPNHIRGYVNLEPFYIQNELSIDDWASVVEKNFGLRTGISGSYESKDVNAAGRWSVLGSVGFDVSTFNSSFHSYGRTVGQGLRPEFPRRATLDYFVNAMVSYQF